MATNQPNGAIGGVPRLPCDEGDLLAWIEGEPLGVGRSGPVTRALDRDPALAARAAAMRGDRAALAGLGEAKAPAGLVEAVARAVEPTLERRMLLGLEREAPIEALPRAAEVRIRRPLPIWSLLVHRSALRYAAAAGLLVAVGAGAYWAATTRLSGGPVGGRIAHGPEAAIELHDGPGEATIAADAPSGVIPPPVDSGVGTPEPTLAKAAEAPVPTPAVEAERGTAAPAMALATAVELARHGRLMVVIEASEPVRAAERIDALAGRGASSGSPAWRVLPEVPPSMLALITGSGSPPPPTRLGALPGAEPLPEMAADDRQRPAIPFHVHPFEGPPSPAPIVHDVDRAYLAEARLDEAAMASMLATLSAGHGWEARFEAAPEPVADETDVLSPSAVLWWAQPPGGWVEWSAVPVVVRRAASDR